MNQNHICKRHGLKNKKAIDMVPIFIIIGEYGLVYHKPNSNINVKAAFNLSFFTFTSI